MNDANLEELQYLCKKNKYTWSLKATEEGYMASIRKGKESEKFESKYVLEAIEEAIKFLEKL